MTREPDITEFLTTTELLASAPAGAARLVASLVRRRDYDAGVTIFEEGDRGEALYVLVSGEVTLSRLDLAGGEAVTAVLKPPAHFGEAAVLGESGRSATARTVTAVTAYLLFVDDFRKVVSEYPTVGRNVKRDASA